jgi:hypothetical protein
MKRQKVKTSKHQNTVLLGLLIFFSFGVVGCQELVHMGQVSDREGAFSVGGVKIEQMQSDGSWYQLGITDGNGRWWIIKDKMQGGGKIRLSKPGYYPIVMSDSEFIQQVNLVLTPTGSSGGFGESGKDFGGSSPSPH